jgi:putative flippase GtrA
MRTAVLGRYIVCGAVATACHFLVLATCVEIVHVRPIGFANLIAAVCGALVAFLGNRYYTFQARGEAFIEQLGRFALLYATGALWHAGGLYVWSDLGRWDYRAGFVVVTSLQIIAIYLGNRFFVFRGAHRG